MNLTKFTKILFKSHTNKHNTLFDIFVVVFGIIFLSSVLISYDTYEWLYNYSRVHEEYEIDEIIIVLLVSPIFFLWFSIRRWIDSYNEFHTRRIKEYELNHTKALIGHDILTGLPNRVLLIDRLHKSIAQAHRHKSKIALAYLDLDGFKAINDTHGHLLGDNVLIKLSNRMEAALRESDTIARVGGDEFVLLLTELHNSDDCFPLLNRLLEEIAKPIQVQDLLFTISASIGVTFYPQKKTISEEQLIRQADQAMYQAKISGKNRLHIFDIRHDHIQRELHGTIEKIRLALKSEQFILYYQPKVNLRTGELVGAEALIRWEHPNQGLLPPIKFLPVIKNHPVSIEIGNWVIEQAIKQIDQWNESDVNIPISINIDAHHLQQKDFIENLDKILQKHSTFKTGNVIFEILETSALENINHISEIMKSCSLRGIDFSLDDFGTGYSSLTYLKKLPAVQLKIDKSFIRGMLNDQNDLAIIEGIIALAKVFKIEVVAEGVETINHGEKLLEMGCDLAQGYAIARPMPASEMLHWVKNWKQAPIWSKRI